LFDDHEFQHAIEQETLHLIFSTEATFQSRLNGIELCDEMTTYGLDKYFSCPSTQQYGSGLQKDLFQ
jgi:hypothetical protein